MVSREVAACPATTSLLPVAVVSIIGLLSIMKMAEASFSPFLYFQF